MKININQLEYSLLFEYAINEWPTSIDLTSLYFNGNSQNKYSVIGLGEKRDDICEKYINTEEEIFICNMHQAIFLVLRSLAEFCTQVNRNSIRELSVKKKFEEKLKRAIEIPDLNASKKDIDLVEKYFSINRN
jgi:hypothetical protein